MLVGAVALLSVLTLSCFLSRSSAATDFSSQFLLYTNKQNVMAFSMMVQSSIPASMNNYEAWLSSISTCAQVDGISMRMANDSVILGAVSGPPAYEVVRLNS